MRRGSRFLIGLATAGITFGALMLTLGQDQFNKYGHRYHSSCYDYHHSHHCDGEGQCEGETK